MANSPSNLAHLPNWPRQLSKGQAASYAGLPLDIFERMTRAGSLPSGIRIEGLMLWDRKALDTAIDRIHKSGMSSPCVPLNTSPDSSSGQTLGALIRAYKASEKFQSLATRTKADYIATLNRLENIESTPLDQITPGFLTRIKDELKVGQRAKIYVVQVLSAVFTWGQQRDWLATNPAHGVEIKKKIGEGNRPWKAHELETVLTEAPTHLRLPIMLAAFAGLRQGDILRLPWSAYDGSMVRFRQGKTSREVVVPVHARLKLELDAAAIKKVGPIIVISKKKARPFTSNGFQGSFFKLIRRLVEQGKIGKGLTFHGLRHTLGTALAETGAATRTIATVLGHANERMSEHYSRRAETAHQVEAAIRSLERIPNRTGAPAVAIKSAP